MVSSLLLTLTMMANPVPSLTSYLQRTLERGVPLYNNGQIAACAAVYATALEGVAEREGWGIPDDQRANLKTQLEFTQSFDDPDARAWAYRRLIDALLTGQPIAAASMDATRLLFDFSDATQVEQWAVALDGVMGGLSTGEISREEDTLVFTGETSLRNNGGFSSIRALLPAGTLAGFHALRIRVKGDGRTWILGANVDPGRRGSSFWDRFETREGEWITLTVPISEMVRQVFGNPVPGDLPPSQVRAVEFYIFDKLAGPFRLQVDRVEVVRLPQA